MGKASRISDKFVLIFHRSIFLFIFSINFSIFNCFENSDRAENFWQTVPIYGRCEGGGGCPLPHLKVLPMFMVSSSFPQHMIMTCFGRSSAKSFKGIKEDSDGGKCIPLYEVWWWKMKIYKVKNKDSSIKV